MPTVPRLVTPQQSINTIPAARIQNPTTVAGLGGDMGGAIQDAAEGLGRIQKQVDATATLEAENKTYDALNKRRTAALQQKGIDALKSAPQTLSDFDSDALEIEKSLGNDRQKTLYRQSATRMRSQLSAELERYAAGEYQKYQSGVLGASNNAAMSEAIRGADNADQLNGALETIYRNNQLLFTGQSQQFIDDQNKQVTEKIFKEIVRQKLDEPEKAEAWYETNKDRFAEDDKADIEKSIKQSKKFAETERKAALKEAESEQIKSLWVRFTDGENPAKFTQAEKQLLGQQYAMMVNRKESGETNNAMTENGYMAWQQWSMLSPEQKAKTDLAEYFPLFDKAHREKATQQQIDARKGRLDIKPEYQLSDQITASVPSALFPVTGDKKRTKEQEAMIGKVRSDIEKRIDAEQSDGKYLTTEQRQKIIDDETRKAKNKLIKVEVDPAYGYGRDKALGDLTPDDIANIDWGDTDVNKLPALAEIPANITEDLQSAYPTLKTENMRRVYTAILGGATDQQIDDMIKNNGWNK